MQSTIYTARPWLMGLLACAALAACGGGGDGQDDSLAQNEGETQAKAQATTSGSWGWIANEGSKFSLSTQRTVRYGANGYWTQKTVSGTGYCSNWFFGKDPIYGTKKRCEVWTPSSTTTTTTSPAATLSWSASSQTGVTGYRVYYGTASHTYLQPKGSGLSVGNVTSYKVSNLQSGKLYYFAVTAIDANGNESTYSNEATKQTP